MEDKLKQLRELLPGCDVRYSPHHGEVHFKYEGSPLIRIPAWEIKSISDMGGIANRVTVELERLKNIKN